MKSIQSDISTAIISEYRHRLSELSIGKANHFFGRAAAIQQDPEFVDILAFCLRTLKTGSLRAAYEQLVGDSVPTKRRARPLVDVAATRKLRRALLYENHPEIPRMNGILNDLFFLQKYGLENSFPLWKPLSDHVRKTIETIPYFSPETLRIDSSFSVNSVFYLKHLGITDQTNRLIKSLRTAFHEFETTATDDAEFTSMIYALTHVVIAASKYYELIVTEYKWVCAFFSEHLREIERRASLDVLSEVALCYKLTASESTFMEEYDFLLSVLVSKSPLPSNHLTSAELNKLEHTNSILMLLFSETHSFLSPPNLSTHPLFINASL